MTHYILQDLKISDTEDYKVGETADLSDNPHVADFIARGWVTDRPPHRKANVRGKGKTEKE